MGADLVVDAGAGLSLLITPSVLVWPRAYGRLLIPPPMRRPVTDRPRAWAAAIAVPFALLAGASMVDWMLGGILHIPGAVHGGRAAAIIWLIFGGTTAQAFSRAVVVAAWEWRGPVNVGAGLSRWPSGLSPVDLDAIRAQALSRQST